MKRIDVRFEVRQGPDGWQLFAVPTHGAGRLARVDVCPEVLNER